MASISKDLTICSFEIITTIDAKDKTVAVKRNVYSNYFILLSTTCFFSTLKDTRSLTRSTRRPSLKLTSPFHCTFQGYRAVKGTSEW